MKTGRILFGLVIVLFIAGVAVGISTAQKEGEMSPAEQAEYMKKFQEAVAPGAHHSHLKDMVGDWNAEIRQYMAPGAEPLVSQGEATYELAFGGRFLIQHMTADMMGMPFEGMGISGFDKTKNKHTIVWADNMGTAITYSEGDCSDHCKKEVHNTTMTDPVMGETMNVKMVTKVIDHNKHVFEMYMAGPDGNEFKSMEIIYTRG